MTKSDHGPSRLEPDPRPTLIELEWAVVLGLSFGPKLSGSALNGSGADLYMRSLSPARDIWHKRRL